MGCGASQSFKEEVTILPVSTEKKATVPNAQPIGTEKVETKTENVGVVQSKQEPTVPIAINAGVVQLKQEPTVPIAINEEVNDLKMKTSEDVQNSENLTANFRKVDSIAQTPETPVEVGKNSFQPTSHERGNRDLHSEIIPDLHEFDREIKAILFKDNNEVSSRSRSKGGTVKDLEGNDLQQSKENMQNNAEENLQKMEEFRVIEYIIPERPEIAMMPVPAIVGFDIDGEELNELVYQGPDIHQDETHAEEQIVQNITEDSNKDDTAQKIEVDKRNNENTVEHIS